MQDQLHRVFVMVLDQTLVRKQDCTVKSIGQSAMAPADHHQADDHLTEDVEVPHMEVFTVR